MGNHRAKGGFTLSFGGANPPDERKEGDTMITYQDLFLFCTFIVALISLIYQIFKDKRK
ncbi:MAG: putative holin-like toxin [Acetatifactor sp.]|nr:putative holin-like toxin [Acetatifactor sp.]